MSPFPLPSCLLPSLSRCRSLQSLYQLHAILFITSTSHHHNHLLFKLLKLSSNSNSTCTSNTINNYAYLLFATNPAPTDFTYNLAIRFFSTRNPILSLQIFIRMLRNSRHHPPGPYTLPFTILAAAQSHPRFGRGIHGLSFKIHLEKHDHTQHSLITMYSHFQDSVSARKLFDEISDRDVVSWNSMVSGYVRMGLGNEAIRLFKRMVEEGWVPNGVTLVSVLTACGETGDSELGEWVEKWVVENAVEVDSFVGSALVDMYGKCGDLGAARRVFDGIQRKDVVAWNAMITGQV